MVHFIFLFTTSHPKEHHKICFTIFGSQKQGDMIFARKPKIQILNKRKGGKEVTLTVDPACQGHRPHGRCDYRRRFLRDGEVSGQTKGTIVIPRL